MHSNRECYSLEQYQEILYQRWNHTLLWLGRKSEEGYNQLWFARPTPRVVWLPGKPRKKYYDRLYSKLRNQLNITNKHYTFATVTYHTEKYSPETAAQLLPAHIKELMRLIRKRYGKVQYFWIIELTKLGYPHVHIIFDHYVHWKVLKAIWYVITKSYVTDIRDIPANNVSSYVAKYVSKTSKLSETMYEFIFKNIDRLWNSSRNFFTVQIKQDKIYILLGFTGDCWFSDHSLYRPGPEVEFWEVDYEQSIPLLSYDTFIHRSLRDSAAKFIDDLKSLFPNQVIYDLIQKMERERSGCKDLF